MIQIEGSQVYVDIEVDGQKFDDEFVKQNSIELFALRIGLSAGFAVPVVSMVIGSTSLAYLNKFKEINTAKLFIGTDPNSLESFDWEVVGRDIKSSPADDIFTIHTGGIITKGNLNSMFLKDKTDEFYEGTALECLTKAWKEEIKTEVDSNITSSEDKSRKYKRNQMTQNFYFVDMLTHIDIRPSFPLATIDKNCNLVLRDFQKLKKDGFVHEFTYARHPMPDKVSAKLLHPKNVDVIPYVGKPEAVSYKTFANRFCGYKQLTGVNTDTGKMSTIAVSILNDEEGWALNTLATTLANESSAIEHKFGDSQGINISEDTPEAYWATSMHNKEHSANMSSVQCKVLVEGKYLPNLKVLDLVKLTTLNDTKIGGLYIVEALELGFVHGSPFTTVVWMCRDNFNDIENNKSKQAKLLNTKGLKIPPSKKAAIVNAVRSSRRGLIHTRNILDETYIREWQRHLISMQNAAVTNFWLFGTSIDLTDNINRANALRNMGSNLLYKLVNKFVAPPFSNTLFNALTRSGTMRNLFFSIIASILGPDLYSEFYGLVSDLILFDQFLDNYVTTISKSTGATAVSEPVLQGRVSFTENADGTIDYNTEPSDKGGTGMTPEDKQKVVVNIVDEIKNNIPDSVDLPIPSIDIDDSDVIKPTDEVKNIIIDKVIDDLIDKGYVYDNDYVEGAAESGNTVYIMKADGTTITGSEAKRTMLSSAKLKSILKGDITFDTVSASRIKSAVGDELKIRHWGTFISEDDLLEWIITQGFMDKYRTVNATKRMTVRGGKRIFVALPTSEKKVKFYINSERVIMNEMELEGLGYYTGNNKLIPYTIYYTTEGYNSNNVTVELRKGV